MVQGAQLPSHVLPLITTEDSRINLLPHSSALETSKTDGTGVVNVPVHGSDEEGDDDYIDDVNDQINDEDEDEDVVIINAAADAFIMDVVPDDLDPKTPPATTVHMQIAKYEHAMAKACDNESSPLSVTLPSQSTLGVTCNSSSSSPMSIRSCSADDGRDDCGALDIEMSLDTPAHVAQGDSELRQATDDTFHSSVKWTESSLTQMLTFELEDICVNGAARMSALAREEDKAVTGHERTSATIRGIIPDDSQPQQQQKRRLACFNSPVKQAIQLETYIKRLVSYSNCSSSAFFVMLIYIHRAQQRCKYLQLNALNVHRVVLAALLAAAKFVEDRVPSNEGFAYIGGEDVRDLNNLEYIFNQLAGWEFFVTGEDYSAFQDAVLQRWTAMNAEGELVVIPPTYTVAEGRPRVFCTSV